jgi:formylglycine-generating enzyme required for sulfatase activity
MKYELSQGQYRDFLNTLTRTQQAARVASTISADTITNVYVLSNPDPADPSPTTLKFRNGIRCPASGNGTTASIIFGCDLNGNGTFNEANDGEWIACNYLTWMDIAAYADWAALRPMTELELEKAARGPNAAVANEYAWGTTSITGATSISYSGRNNEVAGESGYGLCNYNNSAVQGPLRSGFAAGASTTRVDAGVGYYGAMDLSGNNWERVVTLGNSTGRSFTGSHGNGALSDSGHATNSDWPGYSIVNTAVTGATGSGFRGGDWMDPSTFIRVSSREYAAFVFSNRHQTHGARYCRTAP